MPGSSDIHKERRFAPSAGKPSKIRTHRDGGGGGSGKSGRPMVLAVGKGTAGHGGISPGYHWCMLYRGSGFISCGLLPESSSAGVRTLEPKTGSQERIMTMAICGCGGGGGGGGGGGDWGGGMSESKMVHG
ncbi:AMME syndrome candidate gene 1 protein homolog [Schistocerca nitens]|uniref:AMME syndrome candidate gene 1 protein homolog n=1 Tax=Schistocerca nitens TaxID=7011 RepID=UPI0021193C5A|nr:AMME syndrome candidate gene 1 protein homolog [Schistocerca nitens]